MKNVNDVADERNSISGNIGDADVINHYFADVAIDASYDRQLSNSFLTSRVQYHDAENYIIF